MAAPARVSPKYPALPSQGLAITFETTLLSLNNTHRQSFNRPADCIHYWIGLSSPLIIARPYRVSSSVDSVADPQAIHACGLPIHPSIHSFFFFFWLYPAALTLAPCLPGTLFYRHFLAKNTCLCRAKFHFKFPSIQPIS